MVCSPFFPSNWITICIFTPNCFFPVTIKWEYFCTIYFAIRNIFVFGFIKDGKFDDNDYLEIKGRWKQLIDEEQTRTKGKLTRERKQELLNGILTNTVIYDYGVLKGDHRWPSAIINKDQLKNTYVKVGGETIWLKTIPAFQREKIIEKIRDKGLQVTEQLIADMWVFGGKSKIDNQFEWDKYNLEKGNSSTSSLKWLTFTTSISKRISLKRLLVKTLGRMFLLQIRKSLGSMYMMNFLQNRKQA